MSGYIGKDGKTYKTFLEKSFADDAWDKQRAEQRVQNRLIEEQNNLIRKQREEERIRYEQDKKDRELEENRRFEHEKELRKLRLCDDIGISKHFYDNFVDNLTAVTSSDDEIDLEKETFNLKSNLNDLNTIIQRLNSNSTIIPSHIDESLYDDCYEDVVYSDSLKQLNESLKKKEEEYKKLEEKTPSKKWNIIFYLSIALMILSIIIALNTKNEDIESIFFILTFGFWGLWVVALVKMIKSSKKIALSEINVVKRNIENAKKSTESKKILSVIKLEEKASKYEEQIKALESKQDAIIDATYAEVQKRWNDFVIFRKNHYNPKIEKFLLDMELNLEVRDFDISYSSIKSSEKLGDGTIEDYIDYFNK